MSLPTTGVNPFASCLRDFYFDDARWDRIWARYEEKGDALIHADLRELFPDEPALRERPGDKPD